MMHSLITYEHVIGALCEGAALLATSFQPLVLSGALLDFLGKDGPEVVKRTSVMLTSFGLAV